MTPRSYWEKWPLLIGAIIAIAFSVRLYDTEGQGSPPAAVLLTLGSVFAGAFIVIASLDWMRHTKKRDIHTHTHGGRRRHPAGPPPDRADPGNEPE